MDKTAWRECFNYVSCKNTPTRTFYPFRVVGFCCCCCSGCEIVSTNLYQGRVSYDCQMLLSGKTQQLLKDKVHTRDCCFSNAKKWKAFKSCQFLSSKYVDMPSAGGAGCNKEDLKVRHYIERRLKCAHISSVGLRPTSRSRNPENIMFRIVSNDNFQKC